MKLVRLTYASRFSQTLNTKGLQDILNTSRENNPKNFITGALCYSPGCFLQVLEGPSAAVNRLFRDIVGDSRNLDVTLLAYQEVDERCFANWAMAYLPAQELPANEAMRFSPTPHFDPFQMNGNQALRYLQFLIARRT